MVFGWSGEMGDGWLWMVWMALGLVLGSFWFGTWVEFGVGLVGELNWQC